MRTSRALIAITPIAAIALAGCGGGSSSTPITSGVAGSVSTVAGASEFGTIDGVGGAARFQNPANCAVAADGNIFVCDFDNGAIRKVSPQGAVTTVTFGGNFRTPFGIAIAPDGSLYVSTDDDDSGSHSSTTGTVWKINQTTGVPTALASDIGRPRGIVALRDGRLVLSDHTNDTISLMDAGTGAITPLAGTSGSAGFNNATGTAALFDIPYGVAQLPNGDIIVADQNNNRIREVTLAGVVTTFAGTGAAGSANGARLAATFNHPEDVDCDSVGNVYVDDHDNGLIRKIAPNGTVTTLAGSTLGGFADGVGSAAKFNGMEGIALNPSGSALYVADGSNGESTQVFSRLRKVICK